jgi:nucleoside 2-deoxyribosyltransferase
MQFTSPFNELYGEVITPVCADLGIKAYRASDIYRPGVVLQDIIQGLAESNVIIAEITPANPNVFYELGYAHALYKPVILLAERDTPLPFDVGGYRVIFYENAIRGKSSLETELRRHLSNIFNE